MLSRGIALPTGRKASANGRRDIGRAAAGQGRASCLCVDADSPASVHMPCCKCDGHPSGLLRRSRRRIRRSFRSRPSAAVPCAALCGIGSRRNRQRRGGAPPPAHFTKPTTANNNRHCDVRLTSNLRSARQQCSAGISGGLCPRLVCSSVLRLRGGGHVDAPHNLLGCPQVRPFRTAPHLSRPTAARRPIPERPKNQLGSLDPIDIDNSIASCKTLADAISQLALKIAIN
jgi:hypothetical protein